MSNKPVKKGPHNIRGGGQGQGRGGGTQRGKQGGGPPKGNNWGGRRPMVVRDKNQPQKLGVINRGTNKGQVMKIGGGKIVGVLPAQSQQRKVQPAFRSTLK